ncbi:MAG: alanine--tRNA ligase [Bacilli bacterium]|nr:alanine--tRNA ligase [Bacilli bacterium]
MKKMTGNEIIKMYLEFFKERGHTILESASLIPQNDPTVLWINAGVTPLKKYFDGSVVPKNKRLTSCQKCIRTGDIESVGKTARHHTFFQMLGNFSIGDYFRNEAITWAYELLTNPKYFDIDKDKLYVTVYPDDIDTYNLWVNLGIKPSHIIKLENNFWEIGPGPSGPDTEIFFDRGEKYDKEKKGIKLLENEEENDRYIEIWNNVLSQFNATEGLKREEYPELPSKNIDTGMGVERMACILQGTETNYETDLFMPIIKGIEDICHLPYMGKMEFKVIADHIRTLTFALSDGAVFENIGRGYVLRRLLRRASRMGRKLNINREFLASLVDIVVDNYKEIYPELVKNMGRVKELIYREELLFQKTLLSGESRLEELFNGNNKVISGKDAFKLYDTYGYPIELTIEAASERGFTVDTESFASYMNAQKELARKNRKVESSMNLQNDLLINYKDESKFVGYEKLGLETEIIAIMVDNEFVDSTTSDCYIFLRENPFYAESGGQVSDSGYLKNDKCKLEVLDVIKAPNGQHLLHVKVLEGTVNKNDKILTHVLKEKRMAIMKNHSSVHLLQRSLQELLGDSVCQAGSKVDERELRFDFNYQGKLSDELILKVESLVNNRINLGNDTKIEYMSLDEAKKRGAMALFSDKYGDVVRVVTMGDSSELCAGTHVNNTKDIKKFAIVSVDNKGADTYRIIATTDTNIRTVLSDEISRYNDMMLKLLDKAKRIIIEAKELDIDLVFDFNIDNGNPSSYKDIVMKKNELDNLREKLKKLEKEFIKSKNEKSVSDLSSFLDISEDINGITTIISITNDYDISILKQIVSSLSNRLDNGFVLLANVNDDNSVNFVAKSTSNRVDCGAIVKDLAVRSSGNGGGSKSFAQGGGTDATITSKLLMNVKDTINNL